MFKSTYFLVPIIRTDSNQFDLVRPHLLWITHLLCNHWVRWPGLKPCHFESPQGCWPLVHFLTYSDNITTISIGNNYFFLFSWYVADGMELEHRRRTVVTCRVSGKQDVNFPSAFLKQENSVAYLWEYWSQFQTMASWPATGWNWLFSTQLVTDVCQMDSAGERCYLFLLYSVSYE